MEPAFHFLCDLCLDLFKLDNSLICIFICSYTWMTVCHASSVCIYWPLCFEMSGIIIGHWFLNLFLDMVTLHTSRTNMTGMVHINSNDKLLMDHIRCTAKHTALPPQHSEATLPSKYNAICEFHPINAGDAKCVTPLLALCA